ncbi:MAG TPA: DUF1223 domain-containing protein [Terracidiphilus sp.]|nr:DUF1223 domain-containing protein [Terracidiphilus sp.]
MISNRYRIRCLWPVALLSAAFVVLCASIPGAPAFARGPAAAGTPVLVELFTSEGCSDCPPADDLLARLDREQFAPGVHAIVLSEHVTYWNHQGWEDPFSMQQVDYRQQDYVQHFGLQSPYTPQMVVDGAQQFVGNNGPALNLAMTKAVSDSKQPLDIVDAQWNKDGVHFGVHTSAAHGEHLFAALAQDVAPSKVSAGENAGRTLNYVAVVRALKEYKSDFADGHPLAISASEMKKDAAGSAVRLVVFLADTHTGHVEAVAEQSLTKP